MVTTLASAASAALLLAGSLPAVSAQYYKIDSTESIKASAKTLAYDLMTQYKGNQSGEIPGILPGPPTEHKGDYYWWEGGAMMGTYIDYWKLTGDSTYNDLIMEGMLHQTGPNADYMPPTTRPLSETTTRASGASSPDRHDETCNGGLRWQVPFSNAGYNYKNTIANGCFFNIGARLARYTNNDTYAQHAEKTWDWLWGVNYIDHENWNVYDGGHVEHNCTDVNKQQFSYNAAILTQGAAFMYNYTNGSDVWKGRIEKLTESLFLNFFPNNTGYELACEGRKGQCTADMLSFKGYVHRWLSVVTQIAPFMKDKILPVLRDSTQSAINQCTGGATGRVCGFYWNDRVFVDPAVDKTSGAGEQMNVLAAVSSLLIESVEPPATNNTGGISKGDPDAGSKSKDNIEPEPISTADRAGAGILTAIVLAGGLGTWGWMSFGD
ncbi:glycosyl hydrolase family 76 [Colletotrichum higginsianum]|nr:glycosyl hydrolase family 76 [Colletotrichum higginsianum]